MDAVSRLRDRLRQARSDASLTIAEVETPSALGREPVKPSFSSLEAVTRGRSYSTPQGEVFVIEEHFQLEHAHGHHVLQEFLSHSPETFARLARIEALAGSDLRRAVFLDTETTGLAGGTGTYAFLVGLGRFEGDGFTVRQYFLRDPDEEAALLLAVAEALEPCQALVTFNGRSFDIPLLNTRFILARQAPAVLDRPHLDLLHPARRLWRDRLTSCALSSLEGHILGVSRTEDDVPGWLIPQIYRDFLITGDARPMGQVVYHNRLDILSMVTLAARLGSGFANPASARLEPPDLLSLARWYTDLELLDQAEATYRQALDWPELSRAWRLEALEGLAMLLKRRERRAEAALLWYDLLDVDPNHVRAYVELAKYYEWYAAEPKRALDWTRRALSVAARRAGLRSQASIDWASVTADLTHRLERLQRKVEIGD